MQTRIDALAGAQGVAAGPAGVVVVHPPSSRIVAVEPASGAIRTLVERAPLASPVTVGRVAARRPPASIADGDGYLVGCGGDGTIRRLTPAV